MIRIEQVGKNREVLRRQGSLNRTGQVREARQVREDMAGVTGIGRTGQDSYLTTVKLYLNNFLFKGNPHQLSFIEPET